jgi:ABC-type multidrug transport system ATPase subunit
MLTFSDVSMQYGARVVFDRLDLELKQGFHVILGPNGAGKTTLFRLGAGIVAPTHGRVFVGGLDLARDIRAKSLFGYVSHRPGLQPRLSVYDNLCFWSLALGQSPAEGRRMIARVGRELDVETLFAQKFGALSRGQQQRVSLARALLGNPDLLFLDEPTTGLDPIAAKKLRGQLAGFVADGKTIVYTTHNLYEAEELATNVVLLRDGRVLAQGTLPEIAATFQTRNRLALTLVGEPGDIFRRLGVSASFEKSVWLVDHSHELDSSGIVEALVGEGIKVKEIRGLGGSLESIYEELQR